MKLKAIKQHYYEEHIVYPGQTYEADKIHAERAVKNGICELLEDTPRNVKPRSRRAKK